MRRSALVVSWLTVLVLAPPAAALDSGVFIDPNSPAGKEYSFPLDVLRAQAGGRGTAQAGVAPPRFGIGITPAEPAAAASRRGGRGAAARRSPGLAGRTGPASGAAATARPPVSVATTPHGFAALTKPGSALPGAGLIVAVALAAGLLAGVALSRRGRAS